MRWLAICAVLAGCGRLSFDARPLDDALETATIDASPAITSREAEVMTFSTTSMTFVDVPGATLMVPPSPGQRWWFLVNGYLTSSSQLYDGPEAQYVIDGVPRGIGGTESVEGKPGPWQHFYVFDGTSDWISIQVQLRDQMGMTATVSHLHIVAIPLPATSEPLYASSDATLPVPMGTSTVATLDLGTLTASANYMFFLLDNASESPGSADVEVTWYDPSNVLWRGPDKNPRGSWQSSLYVRTAMVGPGPVVIRLDASSGDTSELAYARVLALRVPSLTSFGLAYVSALVDTIAGPLEVSSVSGTGIVDPKPHYLAFGTMKVDDDCSGNIATRGVHYTLDGVEMAISHKPGNCALDTTYGFLDLVQARPTLLEAAISSGTGEAVEHHESTLILLAVD